MNININPYTIASAAMEKGVSILLFRSGDGVQIKGDIISPSFFIGLCACGMRFEVSLEDWGIVKFIRVKEIKRGKLNALRNDIGRAEHGPTGYTCSPRVDAGRMRLSGCSQ